MAERKLPAIRSVGNLYLASSEQLLRRENSFAVTLKLLHGLTWQRDGVSNARDSPDEDLYRSRQLI